MSSMRKYSCGEVMALANMHDCENGPNRSDMSSEIRRSK